MDYHQDRFKDHSLLLYKKDKLVALFPANQHENVLYSHQGLTYGGLIIHKDLKLRDVKECLQLILEHLKENNLQKLHVKLLPSMYSPFPYDELNYLFFILEAKLVRRDALSVVNMQHRPKMSKDRIAGNKRAIKHGLVIKEVHTFDAFWNQILIPNLAQKHAAKPVHSLAEIQQLKAAFPKDIRQFNVYKDDVIVAGTTIFETEYVAHSQYISGNEDKNTLGSLDFLHVYLLNEIFQDKMYFDFGISNENQGKNINEGLHYWKEGFGARTMTQDFYEIDVQNSHKLETIFI
ncbi:GNAT family N-acetyltransferase [uncultured Kordia sp.]|uniref:GNAT family N-acetyltransferase n=1 Tax=uncultured Kordia sp. TaxID=507699 RepID=UPI00260242C9|nr:GNAT family N-acetyltransferase [uncultured Kordia sp.]